MTNAERLLGVARSQVGIKENPAGSNNVQYNTWYYGHSVYGTPYPWCMVFVQWCYAKTGIPLPYKTASCGALLSWYKEHQKDCIVTKPQMGDIVIFDWPMTKSVTDHTGIFEKWDGKKIVTIEGNTAIGNDSNGGQVMVRTRDPKWVKAYIRPRELEDEMNVDDFIKQLTDKQAYEIYTKATDYMAKLPLPVNWNAKEQLAQAVKNGITDGSRPMCPMTRLEGSLMADRASKKK